MVLSNKLAGDVACLGGPMVEHQPRFIGSWVRFPIWGVCDFFSVSAKASLPISLSPFNSPLDLSLVLKPHSSHLPYEKKSVLKAKERYMFGYKVAGIEHWQQNGIISTY